MRTLLLVRWLAIFGQLCAIVVVAFILDFTMPVVACLGLVALSAWSNVFLRVRFADDRRMPEKWTAWTMGFDIIQLSSQLMLTGGLTNPFALLVIAPVMVSATTLSATRTVYLGGLALFCATLNGVVFMPLPWFHGEAFNPPLLFTGGIWLALVCSLSFMGYYAFRVAEERRQLQNALSATELVLSREQNLQALDGLAAAAAHELGTPLATISVVTRELEREMDEASPIADDIRLLRSQSERCRDILRTLKSLEDDGESPLTRQNIRTFLEEMVGRHRGTVDIHVDMLGGDEDMPLVARNPAVHYGLGNLIENAVQFAQSAVSITADWTEATVQIAIADDGPGFPDDLLSRLGDPFVSRRSGGTRAGGLGLGIFIAKTLLERTSAKVVFETDEGAIAIITWPRRALEPAPPT
ncbi:MAG: ActS/PrrB/RegB family redox-sensitive histidine kinase [Pseudomonadota bacterium]